MKESSAQRMPGDTFGNVQASTRCRERTFARMGGMRFRPKFHVDSVNDQKKQPANRGNPQKAPCDVNRDLLPPRTLCPLYEVQAASPPFTPRIERFTRFLMSGTL